MTLNCVHRSQITGVSLGGISRGASHFQLSRQRLKVNSRRRVALQVANAVNITKLKELKFMQSSPIQSGF